jgi:hypothetical protein
MKKYVSFGNFDGQEEAQEVSCHNSSVGDDSLLKMVIYTLN